MDPLKPSGRFLAESVYRIISEIGEAHETNSTEFRESRDLENGEIGQVDAVGEIDVSNPGTGLGEVSDASI